MERAVSQEAPSDQFSIAKPYSTLPLPAGARRQTKYRQLPWSSASLAKGHDVLLTARNTSRTIPPRCRATSLGGCRLRMTKDSSFGPDEQTIATGSCPIDQQPRALTRRSPGVIPNCSISRPVLRRANCIARTLHLRNRSCAATAQDRFDRVTAMPPRGLGCFDDQKCPLEPCEPGFGPTMSPMSQE